jgi:hypothetical protein
VQLVHATAFTKDTPQQQSRSPKTPSQQHGAALDALDKHCGTTESGKPSQLGSRTKQSLATVSMGGPRVHPHKRPLPRRSCCAEPTRDAQTAGNRCCHHGTEMDSFACPRGTDARRVNADSIERGLERDNRYRGSLNSYPKDEELRISAADSERGTRPAAPTGTARSPSRVAVTGCRQRWLRGPETTGSIWLPYQFREPLMLGSADKNKARQRTGLIGSSGAHNCLDLLLNTLLVGPNATSTPDADDLGF